MLDYCTLMLGERGRRPAASRFLSVLTAEPSMQAHLTFNKLLWVHSACLWVAPPHSARWQLPWELPGVGRRSHASTLRPPCCNSRAPWPREQGCLTAWLHAFTMVVQRDLRAMGSALQAAALWHTCRRQQVRGCEQLSSQAQHGGDTGTGEAGAGCMRVWFRV